MRKEPEKNGDERYQLYCEMIDQLDRGVHLINAYDSVPHDYGSAVMYQAESKIIQLVGKNPGIKASRIAAVFHKTPSACSQLIRRLKNKGWIRQVRNEENNREYCLYLTREGTRIYEDHEIFEQRCYRRSFQNLSGFSEEELRIYLSVQQKLNETFAMDVEESRANGKTLF